MNQIIRELKRHFTGGTLEPEQLKGLIRAGYVYRNGAERCNPPRCAIGRPEVEEPDHRQRRLLRPRREPTTPLHRRAPR
jgi:hypothetical protein